MTNYSRYPRPKDGHIINMPKSVYEDLKMISRITGQPIGKILDRGLMLGKLEAIVRMNNGTLLVQEEAGCKAVIIK